ncbi:MAG: GxxExxY protein [Verrucomicrobia bacterium]|nr:GxxExxY protein [Verrucomicrobiota bacterium]
MGEPICKDESFKIVGACMEVHRELGKGHDEIVYKDALEVELGRVGKIVLEVKAIERLAEPHMKQVLNYLASSKLKLGLLVNFGEDSLSWKRVVL